MKKIFKTLMVIASTALLASCASVPAANKTMQEAQISLQRDQYVIVGRISESATVVASTSAIKNEEKRIARGIKEVNDASLIGDNGKYGFIGTTMPVNMTVKERAVALATYKLLGVAKFNEADALLYVTQDVSIEKISGSKSKVTATVSALAVKVKADVEAQLMPAPVKETAPVEETEAKTEEAAAPAEEAEVPAESVEGEAAQAETVSES